MPDLPTGTVTFLFTDVEGSTRLWEQDPGAMRAALVRHDAIIEANVEAHGGVVASARNEQTGVAMPDGTPDQPSCFHHPRCATADSSRPCAGKRGGR